MKLSSVIILFVFTIPVSVLAQIGDIEGTVYQQKTGKPFAGVDVHITETNQRQKTDENGVFQFTELPEGRYTFVIAHPTESASTAVSVEISSGNTTEVKIYLGEAVKLESIVVEGKRLSPTISRIDIPR